MVGNLRGKFTISEKNQNKNARRRPSKEPPASSRSESEKKTAKEKKEGGHRQGQKHSHKQLKGDHGKGGHGKGGHDHGKGGHDHGKGGHDHGKGGHDHGKGGHDHGKGGHDHGKGGHDHGKGGHDHGKGGHSHGKGGHDHGHAHGHEHDHGKGHGKDDGHGHPPQSPATGNTRDATTPTAASVTIKKSRKENKTTKECRNGKCEVRQKEREEKQMRIEAAGQVFVEQLKINGWNGVEREYRHIFAESEPKTSSTPLQEIQPSQPIQPKDPKEVVSSYFPVEELAAYKITVEPPPPKAEDLFNFASRFKLETNVPPDSDFVAANMICVELPGSCHAQHYIVTATPTEAPDVEKFWKLVFDSKAQTVVCLNELADLNRTTKLVPDKANDYDNFGIISVSCKKAAVSSISSELSAVVEVLPEGCSNSIVPRFLNVGKWPRGVWATPSEYWATNIIIRKAARGHKDTMVVCCPDGKSRSGIFVIAQAAFQSLEEQLQPDMGAILKLVREQRWGSIPSLDHYFFVHLLILNWLLNKNKKKFVTSVAALINDLAMYRRYKPAPPSTNSKAAMRVAANLNMLFTDVPLLQRYEKAARAGFRLVEVSIPYSETAESLREAADNHSLQHVLINAPPGDWSAGFRGIASLASQRSAFIPSLQSAISYAKTLSCPRVHIMAGIPVENADKDAADDTFLANLTIAARQLEEENLLCLIEPINPITIPGYHLNSFQQALTVLDRVASPNLKMQYDLFHAAQIEFPLPRDIKLWQEKIGHIQVAQSPRRDQPDAPGHINFAEELEWLRKCGRDWVIGAEYSASGDEKEGFGWVAKFGLLF